jgi:hypothetical protein
VVEHGVRDHPEEGEKEEQALAISSQRPVNMSLLRPSWCDARPISRNDSQWDQAKLKRACRLLVLGGWDGSSKGGEGGLFDFWDAGSVLGCVRVRVRECVYESAGWQEDDKTRTGKMRVVVVSREPNSESLEGARRRVPPTNLVSELVR